MKRVYNVFFPLFLILIFPLSWIVVLPVNFLIDLLVVFLTFKYLKIIEIKENIKKSILKVWVIGFLSDIIGCLLLMPSLLIKEGQGYLFTIQQALIKNPFNNPVALLVVFVAIIIAAVAIYFLNKKFAFSKTNLTVLEIHKVSLSLAIFTAPYVLLIPTNLLLYGRFW